jgi:colicin import membrane protein
MESCTSARVAPQEAAATKLVEEKAEFEFAFEFAAFWAAVAEASPAARAAIVAAAFIDSADVRAIAAARLAGANSARFSVEDLAVIVTAAAAAAAEKLAEEKANAEAVAARKAQREAAAAKLAAEKAVAEAAAALKAQREAAFSELALWRGLEAENVVGKVGTVNKQIAPASQCELLPRQAAVHHVTNPALQTAYERKKEELAARLGGAANVNERFLFHGTSMANSEAIIRNNFCLSKVRNTITMLVLCGRCH